MKTIKEEYSLGQQSANFNQILEFPSGLRLKIHIKSDSYDFQSHAKAEIFNPNTLSWNLVTNIPYSNMKTPSKLVYTISNKESSQSVLKNNLSKHFKQDTETLIKDCKNILGDLLTKKLDNQNAHVDPIQVPLKTNKKIKLA